MARPRSDKRPKPRSSAKQPSVPRSRTRRMTGKALGLWDAAVQALEDEREQSRATADGSPYYSRDATIDRAIYRMGTKLLDEGLGNSVIERKAISLGKESIKVAFSENPFFWLLTGLEEEGIEFPPPTKTRLAQRMLYASRHRIEPEMYFGFIKQVGLSNIAKKVAKNHRETWLRSYLDAKRHAVLMADPNITARGRVN